MPSSSSKRTPFLDRLASSPRDGVHSSGLHLFQSYLTPQKSADLFQILNDDQQVPWDLKPTLYGTKLNQHSMSFSRKEHLRKVKKFPGLAQIESLCKGMEEHFDVQVHDAFLNRFQDPTHAIQWHTDKFGSHIMVLTLAGSGPFSLRAVEFRQFSNQGVETVIPQSGDLYFMPLATNKTHEHRVCAAPAADAIPNNYFDDKTSVDANTRISIVFFLSTPKYAKDYKITFGDRLRGFGEAMMAT